MREASKVTAIPNKWIVVFKSGPEDAGATNLKGERVFSKEQLTQIKRDCNEKISASWTKVLSGMSVEMSEKDVMKL